MHPLAFGVGDAPVEIWEASNVPVLSVKSDIR